MPVIEIEPVTGFLFLEVCCFGKVCICKGVIMRIFEKIVALVCVLVFLTFLINHGKIDFSGVDFVVDKTTDFVTSEEGKEITGELKEITYDVLSDLTGGLKKTVAKYRLSNSKHEATLVNVVDGDTLIVELDGSNVKVRLIGIDTPESVHEDDSKNTIYGNYASDHTKAILASTTTLYLEYDEDIEDDYGRLLAYVWLEKTDNESEEEIKTKMLNARILADGYAINKEYPPNIKYANVFETICSSAKSSKTGLWSDENFIALWN